MTNTPPPTPDGTPPPSPPTDGVLSDEGTVVIPTGVPLPPPPADGGAGASAPPPPSPPPPPPSGAGPDLTKPATDAPTPFHYEPPEPPPAAPHPPHLGLHAPPPPAGYSSPGYSEAGGLGAPAGAAAGSPGYGGPSGYGAPVPLQPGVPPGYAQKDKLVAGLLAILIGTFGVHNFYLGYNGKAIAQLLITVLSCGILAIIPAIWAIIEGVQIFTGSIATDANGVPLKG